MVDLVVKNATVVTARDTFTGGIAVEGEKVVALGTNESLPAARETLDAEGLHLTPGFVDVHVHFREPGMRQKETWDSGSRAAAAGGFTTIFDMPNCIPPTATPEAFAEKQRIAAGRAMIDYGLYVAVVDNNVAHLEPLAAAGCIGYKLFMGETVGKVPWPPDDVIFDGFRAIARTGLPVGVHAENGPIMQFLIKELRQKGRIDPRAHDDSRPIMIESEAVSRAITIASGAGNRLHIYHLSSIQALEHIKHAKARSQPVTAEVLVNHLLLAVDEHGERLGTLIKMNPPIRSSEHRAALWEALHQGVIDNLASDHAPHAPDEKLDKREVWDVGSGYPGLETNIPLMLTQVHAGKLTLTQLVYWYSEKPARMWSIYPRKGCLSVGSDADFVLIDMNREATIDAAKFHSQAKFSPFDGWKLRGGIDRTFLRGRLIAEKGRIVGAPRGQMIKPTRQT